MNNLARAVNLLKESLPIENCIIEDELIFSGNFTSDIEHNAPIIIKSTWLNRLYLCHFTAKKEIHLKNCFFKGEVHFMSIFPESQFSVRGCSFFGDLVFNDCAFLETFVFEYNTCHGKVEFFDCDFHGQATITNNDLRQGTDLFSHGDQPYRNEFKIPPIVTGNIGLSL